MRNATLAACAAYAGALVIAGAAGLWHAPLTSDENQYYEPAIRFFAARLPHVPLDYPAPSPPFGFVLQALVYRLSGGSVACVRATATLSAIAAVAIVAFLLHGRPRAWLTVLMIGTLPPMLVYAFSLKQHWMTVLFLIAGYALWQRGHNIAAPAALLCAVLTNQIAAAFVLALVVRQLVTRHRVIPYLLPLVTLGGLALFWGGLQPPMYNVASAAQPRLLHLYLPQILLLLFMAGIWIVPMIAQRWRPVAASLAAIPLAAFALHGSRIMNVRPEPDPAFYEHATGPMLGLIRAITSYGLMSVFVASIAVAVGCALIAMGRDDDVVHAQTYAAAYALVMLPVPFFFESYYAIFVIGSWTILSRRMAESRSIFTLTANIGAIVIGTGYAVFRFRMPS